LSKVKDKKLRIMEVLPVRVTVLQRRNKSLFKGLTSIALDR
jgi:hypothetical protein